MKNKKKELTIFFKENNIENYNIEYYPKVFGDMVINFEYRGTDYRIISDRGEIVVNGVTKHLASYLDQGISTLDVIKKEILEIIYK